HRRGHQHPPAAAAPTQTWRPHADPGRRPVRAAISDPGGTRRRAARDDAPTPAGRLCAAYRSALALVAEAGANLAEMRSGDPNVRLRKILAFEQKRQAKILGTGMGKTVAQVEVRGVAATAETLEGPDRAAAEFRADRNDLRRCLGNKPVERGFGVRHRGPLPLSRDRMSRSESFAGLEPCV